MKATTILDMHDGKPGRRRYMRPALLMVSCAFLIAGLSMSVHAQLASDEPIALDHADRTTIEVRDEGNVYIAVGNVHFVQGATELWAQRALWYEATGVVKLYGDVRVVDTAETIEADSLFYTDDADIAYAYGHVKYTRAEGDLEASGDLGEYSREEHWAKLYDNARIVSGVNDTTSRVETWADTLLLVADADSAVAWGNVRVIRNDGDATAEHAVFVGRGDSDRVILSGSPQGKFDENDVSGDTLYLWIVADKMHELVAAGNAHATYRESSDSTGRTTESEIESRRMQLLFANGSLADLIAIGQARSQYVPAAGKPGERNDASGDTVKVSIVDSTVNRVQVIGGAEGTYFSPKIEGGEVNVDTVRYKSSYIDYHVDKEWIRLYDRSDITYGSVNLAAGQVLYLTQGAILRAYPLADSLLPPPPDYVPPATGRAATDSVTARVSAVEPSDSLPVPFAVTGAPGRDTSRAFDTLQRPVLRDGAQEVRGQRLVYDLNTQRGRIVQSTTHTADGYYHGGDFRKESDNVFFARDGRYTTCDLDEPHFAFTGSRMKLKKDDRVISRPVVLRVEKLPVLWIPYYVFSIRKDRHSGMLPFRFGNLQRGSRFINNLGYYFAVSEYFDFTPAMDIREEDGILWKLSASYAVRYKLNGGVSATYNRHNRVTTAGENLTEAWSLRFHHNHQIDPTLSIAGSGNFVSSSTYYQDFSTDLNERLSQSLHSQVNLSKRWGGTALTVAAVDDRDLQTNRRSSTLPQMSLTFPSQQLFAPKKLKGGRTAEPRWYHNFRVSYRNNGAHRISRPADGSTEPEKRYATLDHSGSLSFNTKAFGVLSLNPGFNVQETWYYVFDRPGDTLPAGVEAGTFYRRTSGSGSISSQTNLYGVFPLKSGPVEGFRHVMTPSLSFAYTPAVVKHDEVRSFTGVGGGGPRQSASLSMGLSHQFQMKTKTEKQERVWDLLTVSSNTSYDFKAEVRKLAPIRSSIRSGLIRNPDIQLSLTHDPYDPVTQELDYTPRLTNVTANARLHLRGGGASNAASSAINTGGGIQPNTIGTQPNTTTAARGWSASFDYSFSESRRTTVSGDVATVSSTIAHQIGTSIRFSPTPLWVVQTNIRYDIKRHEMADWSIQIDRDLHCWSANFSWVPTGLRSGYYFRVNVKALPDVKYEKSESGIGESLFRQAGGGF